jgi:predicted Zn-ribbon and HTH transcriptional regulator
MEIFTLACIDAIGCGYQKEGEFENHEEAEEVAETSVCPNCKSDLIVLPVNS